ncbi:MAG TPA: dihydroorotate dehydrogenase electron transfer subunit [Methanoregulaceae archaeon]|nr:dihydroorotate dehydrogenase electron transfer subunit [Methanoregulaceae archaeon]
MNDRLPVAVGIRDIKKETPSVSTIRFDHSFSFIPGQFVMVWVPGVDEIPMALSSGSSITVQDVGEATAALTALAPGDMVGIRGPYGNGFPLKQGTLAIAGGLGAAPLLPLAETGHVRTCVLGARSAKDLVFRERFETVTDLRVMTDDGSAGRKGFAVQGMDGLDLPDYSQICVCGPEVMMVSVLDRLRATDLADAGRFSLHRYMKCGCGVCGSCCIDPSGARVCREGPVFSGTDLIGTEFGNYSRDGSGRKRPF